MPPSARSCRCADEPGLVITRVDAATWLLGAVTQSVLKFMETDTENEEPQERPRESRSLPVRPWLKDRP